jgi:hypothetical protein
MTRFLWRVPVLLVLMAVLPAFAHLQPTTLAVLNVARFWRGPAGHHDHLAATAAAAPGGVSAVSALQPANRVYGPPDASADFLFG